MSHLRQNSGTGAGSGPTITIGPCLDADGVEYTGLVIGDLTLTKNGTSAAMAANATLTHTSNGHYDLVMIGDNANTVGKLNVRCNKSTYQIPPVEYEVLEEAIYDALYAASANGFAGAAGSSTMTFSNTTIGTTTNLTNLPTIPNNWITAAGINSGAFTAAKFASDFFSAIWDKLTSSITTVGSIGKFILDEIAVLTGRLSSARAGYLDNLNVGAVANAADMATLLGRLTSARAGYLDKLNVSGNVAAQADITALNQSASRRIIITTIAQYERPETGSTAFQLEARTYDEDGAAVNADSTPTMTATGITSGSLAANLSAASSPATGVYRWTYTVEDDATLEQIRFDLSAVLNASTFTLAAYSQVCDFVAVTFTTADRALLTSIDGKSDTTLARIGAFAGSGLNTILGMFRALFRKTAALTPSDVGGTYNNVTMSLEAQQEANELGFGDVGLSISGVNSTLSIIQAIVEGIPTLAQFEARTLVAASYATAAAQATMQTSLTKFETMIVADGLVYKYTVNALEDAPAGGGGGGGDTIVLGPVVAGINPTNGVGKPLTLEMFSGETKEFLLSVFESDGTTPVDLSLLELRFVVYTATKTPTLVLTVADADIDIEGDNDEIARVPVTATAGTNGNYNWVLLNVTTNAVILNGRFNVLPALLGA